MRGHVIRYRCSAPRMLPLDTQLIKKHACRSVDRLAITLDDVVTLYSDGREKIVPRGFPMDYASIPPSAQVLGHLLKRVGLFRRVTSFDPTDGATLLPVVNHDSDYSLQEALDVMWGWTSREGLIIRDDFYPLPPIRTRADADKDLRDGLRITSPPRAEPYYFFVHRFGGWSWRKQNAPLMDGYIQACRDGTNDQWIEHVRKTFTQVVDLRVAE